MSEQNSLDLADEYKINCVSFNTNNSLLPKKFRSRVFNSVTTITIRVSPKLSGLRPRLQIEGERQKLECREEGLFYAFNRAFTSLAQAGAVKARRNAFNNH